MSVMNNEDDLIDEEVGVEEAPVPAPASATETKSMSIAGVTIDETQLPIFVVLVASIVLLIATGAEYDWKIKETGGYSGYAISVSSVAMVLSFIGLLFTKFLKDNMYSKFGKHMNMLCFVYSFIGACFLTFDKPFTNTGNGYFAAWAIVYGSAMAMGMTARAFGSTIKGLGAIMGLLASSLVVILASIAPVRDGVNKSEAVYAMALACVTFVFILLLVGYENRIGSLPGMASFVAFTILAMCWILEACLVTFRGPFDTTGNGYFASWAGAGTASIAAFAANRAI